MIDRFGELSRKIDEFRPVEAEHKKLKDEIEHWYSDHAADESFVVEGKLYSVQVSRRAVKRTIVNMRRLFNLLKSAKFLSLCTFPLSVLDKEVPLIEHTKICRIEAAGPRSVRAVAKASALKAA